MMKDYMMMDIVRKCENCGKYFIPNGKENICYNCEIDIERQRNEYEDMMYFDYMSNIGLYDDECEEW